MVTALVLVIILVFMGYLYLFAIWNQTGLDLNLWFGGWQLQGAAAWQVALGAFALGMGVAVLCALIDRLRSLGRVRFYRDELKRVQTASEESKKRLANAEAKVKELDDKLKEVERASSGEGAPEESSE